MMIGKLRTFLWITLGSVVALTVVGASPTAGQDQHSSRDDVGHAIVRWKNVQDEPVIARGPERYDRHAVAMNQVIRYEGHYVGVYHANDDPQWKGPWTTCLATSNDLVHWQKYGANPVIPSDDSSGILVHDGRRFRLYTMHPMVKLWLPPGSRESDRR